MGKILDFIESVQTDTTLSNNTTYKAATISDLVILTDLSSKYVKTNKVRNHDNIRYIIWCHEVDQNISYYKTIMKSSSEKSWHFLIDGDVIYNTIDVTKVAKFSSDGNINDNGIGIMLCNTDKQTINTALNLRDHLNSLYLGCENLSIQEIEGNDIIEQLNVLL
jgi:N-acetyl-anhydromuramyl-L-alanine amidase AmpD